MYTEDTILFACQSQTNCGSVDKYLTELPIHFLVLPLHDHLTVPRARRGHGVGVGRGEGSADVANGWVRERRYHHQAELVESALRDEEAAMKRACQFECNDIRSISCMHTKLCTTPAVYVVFQASITVIAII